MKKTWYEIKNAKANAPTVISLYGDIGGWGISAQDLAFDLQGVDGPLDVHIHSRGGSPFEASAIYTMLRNHKADVTVYVDGIAASAASVIAMAGKTVVMPENAWMMIHNPSWGIEGTATDHRKAALLLDKIAEALIPAYTAKTQKTAEEIQVLMDAETWMTGKDAVEMGFADRMSEAIEITASFDLSQYKNAPALVAVQQKEAEMPEDRTAEVQVEALQAEIVDLQDAVCSAQSEVSELQTIVNQLTAPVTLPAEDPQVAQLKVQLAASKRKDAEHRVDALITAQCLKPAGRPGWIEMCMQDPDRFESCKEGLFVVSMTEKLGTSLVVEDLEPDLTAPEAQVSFATARSIELQKTGMKPADAHSQAWAEVGEKLAK